jgi:hypothetical protein
MSADNWSVCPKCKEIAQKEFDDLMLKAGESYGKVSPEEYLERIHSLPKEPTFEHTLREDYEFYLDDNFDLLISYQAHCGKCNFKFTFRKELNILEPES